MEDIRIDCAHQSEAELVLAREQSQLVFRLNHTMPMTAEYDELLHRLFPEMGSESREGCSIQHRKVSLKHGRMSLVFNR